jgi:hypothetical protein
VSLRPIKAGEEIVYDYATSQTLVDPLGKLQCGCGDEKCRRLLLRDDWKRKDVQDKFGFHFVPYILPKIGWFVHIE